MNLKLQRWVDRWIGIPLCALVSAVDAVTRRLRRPADAPPRAIVVILLSEMGSLVLAHDMFARLKTRYPDAPVHALLFGKNREILDLMGLIAPAHVHTVNDKSLGSLLRSLFTAIRELRHAQVDVAIDCELFSRISSLLSYASGAVLRVGFHRHTQEGLYRGSHINRPVPYNPYQHISAQFLTLARATDARTTPKSKPQAKPHTELASQVAMSVTGKPPPQVALPPLLVADLKARLAQDFPAIAGKPLVLVYPGGGILPIRAWPLSAYATLCEGLVADGCAVAVIGLHDDKALAQELVAHIHRSVPGSPAIDLTGYTRSVAELLALFHLAQLLVTNDGGPGQFAALTPIWTLMLFGPETPGLYAPLTPKCFSFYSGWPCSPCLTAYNHRASYCDGDNQCLKAIAPAEVLAKSRECLALS